MSDVLNFLTYKSGDKRPINGEYHQVSPKKAKIGQFSLQIGPGPLILSGYIYNNEDTEINSEFVGVFAEEYKYNNNCEISLFEQVGASLLHPRAKNDSREGNNLNIHVKTN